MEAGTVVGMTMNIFVVGTGRCGSTTFAAACKHAVNMTAGHETAAGRIYDFIYPPNHIEVDPPLTFWINKLRSYYPGCKFVHLIREVDREGCIHSLAVNDPDICQWFGRMIYHFPECQPSEGAEAIYEIMNSIVQGEDVLRIRLVDVKERWWQVWEWMGCKGDFYRSLKEWDVKYNETPIKGDPTSCLA